MNVDAAFDYLRFGRTIHRPETMLEDTQQLMPGRWIEIDCYSGSIVREGRYWLPSTVETLDVSTAEAADALRGLFPRSVDLHLRSDVPLAMGPSGGIDSSSFAAEVRYSRPKAHLNTFSCVAENPRVSEEPCVDSLSAALSLDPGKIKVHWSELPEEIELSGHPPARIFREHEHLCTVTCLSGGTRTGNQSYTGWPRC